MKEPEKPEDLAKDQLKKYNKGANTYLKYMGAGVQLVAPVVLGALVGYWIDHSRHNVRPIWTIVLSSVMIIVALYLFIRQFLQR